MASTDRDREAVRESAATVRVLVACHDSDLCEQIRSLLADEGYSAEPVADGAAALAAARREAPDLLIAEPATSADGFDLLSAMRDDGRLQDTPIILLSAPDAVDAHFGFEAGADDYLIKPFSAQEFRARVTSNLRHARLRRETARRLAEERHILETLNRVGSAVAAELNLERAVQVVTDAATELTGAAFGAFFYNVLNARGESYMLYTLSGVPREAFSKFPMPRNTAIFGPTFAGEAIVRSDDITKDSRYGRNEPYRGMPEGHLPVRSYLAAPVASRSGEVLGGLFFGHPEPAMFGERAEQLLAGIATQAAIAIDNARLYDAAQREIAERKHAEQERESVLKELQRLNENLEEEVAERTRERDRIWTVSSELMAIASFDGYLKTVNPAWSRLLGHDEASLLARPLSELIHPDDLEPAAQIIDGLRQGQVTLRFEDRLRSADGSYRWISWTAVPEGDRFYAVGRDVTEEKAAVDELAAANRQLTTQIEERERVEQALRQAQKMETIGQLTGGVAHDFNNLLTIIMGNLETLRRQLARDEPDAERLQRSSDNALRGAQRAASLTQRLLAFSRRQPLEPKVLQINKLVSNMSELLRRTLGETIEVETVLAGGLWRTHADPNQLEAALLNLAINARDAMADGGRLTIETANAYLDERYSTLQAEVAPGQYVVIAITDTGAGMNEETIAQAFEPFFTTKDVGHGTGLGLSQVYGFVKQSGGHVKIYSEVGEGTTVKIYLPRLHSDEEAGDSADRRRAEDGGRGGEVVLVVEDDDDVRTYSTDILTEMGLQVLEAPNGHAALDILDDNRDIALLFTDVGLPGGMNGRELAEEARRRRPQLKVLFTTGYARNAIVHDGRLDPGVELVTKPFTYAALATRIRDLLDSDATPPCVLVVDDEALVRMLAVDLLEELGFRVTEAATATEAISKIRLLNAQVRAAVVDIGLPDRRGDALAAELRAMYADLPIVMATGYGSGVLKERLEDDQLITFLGKPYDGTTLRKALEDLKVSIPGTPAGTPG